MALKERVEDYVGTFDDVAALNAWYLESARRHIDLSPQVKLRQYAQKVTTTLPSLTDYMIIEVYREGVRCRRGDFGMEDRYVDTGSKDYASANDPAWLPSSGSIVVIPTIALPTSATYAKCIKYPTSIDSPKDVSIGSVPREITDLVVLDVAIRATHVILGELSSAYALLTTRLDTEEDIELANAKMQEIQLKIADYQAKVRTLQSIYQTALQTFLGAAQTKQEPGGDS
jgi:hypothetical protein